MFGSKKKTPSYGQVETIIGKDTIIKGLISGTGTIRIDGEFEGEINTNGNLMIGEKSKVTAQIKALNATIAGTIYGNVDITEKLDLMPSAQIFGDLKVGVLCIGEGAVFTGACQMRENVESSIDTPKVNLQKINPPKVNPVKG
jgi:cytoskeletal protein CcmA (bactofilin family)